jgi:membrane-associated phospholipid phosphatase
MPGLETGPDSSGLVDALLPLVNADSGSEVAADLWLYPASFPLSGLILFGCACLLWRRGRTREAAVWPAAWVVGTAIEAVTKHALERPALFSAGLHLDDLDHALPSGHTLRSFLVAAAVTSLWRRGRWAWLWAATVWLLVVEQGWHTPTDVAGGLLLAGILLLAGREYVQRGGVDRSRLAAPGRDDGEPRAAEPEAHAVDR